MPYIEEYDYLDEIAGARHKGRYDLVIQLQLVQNDDMSAEEKVTAMNAIIDDVYRNNGR